MNISSSLWEPFSSELVTRPWIIVTCATCKKLVGWTLIVSSLSLQFWRCTVRCSGRVAEFDHVHHSVPFRFTGQSPEQNNNNSCRNTIEWNLFLVMLLWKSRWPRWTSLLVLRRGLHSVLFGWAEHCRHYTIPFGCCLPSLANKSPARVSIIWAWWRPHCVVEISSLW